MINSNTYRHDRWPTLPGSGGSPKNGSKLAAWILFNLAARIQEVHACRYVRIISAWNYWPQKEAYLQAGRSATCKHFTNIHAYIEFRPSCSQHAANKMGHYACQKYANMHDGPTCWAYGGACWSGCFFVVPQKNWSWHISLFLVSAFECFCWPQITWPCWTMCASWTPATHSSCCCCINTMAATWQRLTSGCASASSKMKRSSSHTGLQAVPGTLQTTTNAASWGSQVVDG